MNHNMRGMEWMRALARTLIFAAGVLLPVARAEAQGNSPSGGVPAVAPAANLLRNAGFEDGEITPIGWNKGPAVDGVEYLWTTGVAYERRASVCLSKKEKRYFPIAEWSQEIPHNGAATKLGVKAMVKAQEVTKAIIDVKYRDEAGDEKHKWAAYVGAKNPNDPPVTHDWKEYGGEVEIPAGTKTIKVALQIYGPGVVAFDNVSAVAAGSAAAIAPSAPSAPNVAPAVAPAQSTGGASAIAPAPVVAAPRAPLALVNASFETGAQQPDGWQQGAAIPGVEYLWAKGVAHTGSASVGFRKTADRYVPIAKWDQTVPRTGTAPRIRVSAWVKCEQVTKAIVDVEFTDAKGGWRHQWVEFIGAKNPNDPPLTHDWTQYSGVVPIPPDTTQLHIGLQMYGPGTVWFDDVEAAYVEGN